MSSININASSLGNSLQALLLAQEIVPGDVPSYQICKALLEDHPIGGKLTRYPIKLVQSQKREISIPNSPEEDVREAFLREWKAIDADKTILNAATLARAYGISTITVVVKGVPSDRPIDPKEWSNLTIAFNVMDPLNTAGSLVLNQDPNAMDFQKHAGVTVQGQHYHRSRTVTLMNEDPIYISYTNSAFGFVGRSVFQRALFPMKSFIATMTADDMVARKVGLLIAKMKPAGSIVDNIMASMAGVKRNLLKEAESNNVMSISVDEDITSLDLTNLEGPLAASRKNILENIASASDMPAKLLTEESLSSSLNEGTEESKRIAQFVDNLREWLNPAYDFFDQIVQRRAWNVEFYENLKAKFPEDMGSKTYTQCFYEWSNSFKAEWPSFIREPDSEKIKVDQTRLEAAIAAAEVLLPILDPENKAAVVAWLGDTFNENKMLFQNPLTLDIDALREYVPPQPEFGAMEGDKEPAEPKPFKAIGDADSVVRRLTRR